MVLAYFHNIREGFKKIVEESAKSPPPTFLEKKLLAKNDLHVMKRIPYDTGWRTIARRPHKKT